jgi:hypothetical protein
MTTHACTHSTSPHRAKRGRAALDCAALTTLGASVIVSRDHPTPHAPYVQRPDGLYIGLLRPANTLAPSLGPFNFQTTAP